VAANKANANIDDLGISLSYRRLQFAFGISRALAVLLPERRVRGIAG
jgi:hypothetical protein